jgi:hypothetical protein
MPIPDTRLTMLRLSLTLALLLASAVHAGEPSPIEDTHFFPESGWNRTDGVLQYNAFVLNRASALELTQEWGASERHQLSYTIPVYSDGETGLGDVSLNYRFQLLGDPDSRAAIAPRLSLLLPTRSAHFGERSSGLQLSVPVSATLTPRLVSHTNAGATWYRDRGTQELNLAQGFVFAATSRLTLALDGAFTRCNESSHLVVVRPSMQFSLDGPAGLAISPGVAMPFVNGTRGVLFFVTFEHAFR